MNCKSWALVLLLTMVGLDSCMADFGDWIKKMNNKTRSASDTVNQFIDKAKLKVGTHLIGNLRHSGIGIKSEDLDSESGEKGDILQEIFGSPDSEDVSDVEIVLSGKKTVNKFEVDEKEVDKGDILLEIFGPPDSEDGSDVEIVLSKKKTVNKIEVDEDFLISGSHDSEDDIEEDVHLSDQRTVNETGVDEDDPDIVLGELDLELQTSTLTIPTIIGISSAGCVCFLIVVILTILTIIRKKNQDITSSTEAGYYDRGYGEDVGNGETSHYDRESYKEDHNDYYPVI